MADKSLGIEVTGDISDVSGKLDELANQIEGFGDTTISFTVDVESGELDYLSEIADGVSDSLDSASEAASGLSDSLMEIDTTNLDAAKESADGLSDGLSGAGSGAEGVDSSGGMGDLGEAGLDEALGGGIAAIGGVSIFDELTDAAGEYIDSWGRIGSVFGQTAETAEASWSGAVSSMASNTGRKASDIRNYIAQMGIAGVTQSSVLESMFTGISGAAFATGTSVETITNAMRRVISTGTLGARQLMTMGLSEQDVMNATGMSLEEVNEKLKGMDSNQRAAFLGSIVNAKYAASANENYKNSWQHVKDQMGASFDMFMRVFGEMMLPIVIPAMQIVTELVKGLAKWFDSLTANQKLAIGVILALGLGFVVLAGILAVLIPVVGLLNLTFLANPLFWVVMGVVALVAAFLYFYNTNEQFRKSIDGLWAGMVGFGAWLQGSFNGIVAGVTGAWNWMVNSIISSINWFINLPKRMAMWGYNAIKSFADGIRKGIKPVTDALGGIGRLFPHSPPKEGPLAEVKPEGMHDWLGTIVGAGNNALANFNLGQVGLPNPTGASSTTNTSATHITVDMAGVTLGNELDAKTAGEALGSGLASKLSKQASNAGVDVVNARR